MSGDMPHNHVSTRKKRKGPWQIRSTRSARADEPGESEGEAHPYPRTWSSCTHRAPDPAPNGARRHPDLSRPRSDPGKSGVPS